MKTAKEVWLLTDVEFKEIEDLFERKLALENLTKVVDPSNEALYEKLVKDYGMTVKRFEGWWSIMKNKYNWPGQNWWLDFNTMKIMTYDNI